jgi:hypothetical protein
MVHADTIHRRILDARPRFERAGIEAAVDADVPARHALGGWERGQLIVRLRGACPTALTIGCISGGFCSPSASQVNRTRAKSPFFLCVPD